MTGAFYTTLSYRWRNRRQQSYTIQMEGALFAPLVVATHTHTRARTHARAHTHTPEETLMDEVDRSLREGVWKDRNVSVITTDGVDGSDWFMVAPGQKQRNTFSTIDGDDDDDDDINNDNNNNNSNNN